MSQVLVVNPSVDERKAMGDAFHGRGREVLSAGSIEEALHALACEDVEQVVSVRTLPDGSGELLIQQAKEVSPHTRVLLVTNFSEVRSPSDLLRFDVADYIVDVDGLVGVVAGARSGPAPSHRSLVDCFLRTVEAVVGLIELTNPLAAGNAASAKRLGDGVAREMGLTEGQRQEVALAALLHDIGNFDVGSGVLDKSDALELEEATAVRQHTVRGVQLLDHIEFPWRVKPVILHHHERYDGGGYPDGKRGRGIPIGARILAVVDAYLSMTAGRPHRAPLSHDDAMSEVQSHVGTQFDPEVVEAFAKFVHRRKQFAGDLFQVKVLVLEGSDQRLARLKLNFLREDFKVTTAQDTQDAIERVEAEDVRFVVADVTSDKNRGLQILDGLQGRLESFQTAVLLLDRESSREQRLTALENGAEEVFPIDVSVAEVMSRMRRLMRRDKAARRGTLASEGGGIRGDLSHMPLPEILQMLNMGQKTAKIVISASGYRGELFLDSGRLTHAECAGAEGAPALTKLLTTLVGSFEIHHGVVTDQRSVDRDAMAVLLDTMRVIDEGRRRTTPPAG